jgi:hypothetical protein
MRSLLALSLLALVAGCASYGDDQYAKAECKVAPITTYSATGVRPSRVDSLAQRDAEMQLGTTQYRRDQLVRNGLVNNNVEQALRDCY